MDTLPLSLFSRVLPYSLRALKGAFDAFVYIRLALGIYGIIVLAAALVVIPIALQFGIRSLVVSDSGLS